jgi:hypothetical protein
MYRLCACYAFTHVGADTVRLAAVIPQWMVCQLATALTLLVVQCHETTWV